MHHIYFYRLPAALGVCKGKEAEKCSWDLAGVCRALGTPCTQPTQHRAVPCPWRGRKRPKSWSCRAWSPSNRTKTETGTRETGRGGPTAAGMGSPCQGAWEGARVMAGLCHGSKQSPGGGFLHSHIAKICAQSLWGRLRVSMSCNVGRSSWKVRAKSMAKLLEAVGGPSSFHRHFQSAPQKPQAGKGGHGLGPGCGGTPGLCSAPPIGRHRATTRQELNEAPAHRRLVNK